MVILEDEFFHISLENHAKVLVKKQNINEIIEIKKQIQNIKGVSRVIWLDDFVDMENVPLEYIPDEVKINYFKDGKALFEIIFEKNVNTSSTKKAIKEINTLLIDIGGVGLEERSVVEIGTIAVIIAFVILIFIIILFTDSFMQALLMIITLCLAIIFNLGTNIIFGEISNITLMAASVIQLAVSIDYTLIFFKNFRYLRENNDDINSTIIEASSRSFKTILASSLTTIAGFLALSVMNYKIGIELGVVLAKGVTLSLITVVILLPILVKIFIKGIDKTKHKPLLPSINFLSKIIHGKISYIVLIILSVLIFAGYLGQRNNEYLYSENHIEYHEIEKEIIASFGEFNDLILIIPRDEQMKELSLVGELSNLNQLKSIKNIYLLPEETPDYEKMMFVSKNHSLIYLTFDLEKESDQTFTMIEKVRETAAKYYEDTYLIGKSAIIYDTKSIIESDYLHVIIISIIFIMLIILFSFKSIAIPLLLILVIQTAIWINMAIPYYQGTKLSFLGYILVSSIQLGATIDYAIILTDNYERERQTKGKVEAAKRAFIFSNQAILVSMLALIIAGISLTLMIDMDLVKDLGILISRGTFISGVLSLLFLPTLLILFDKFIDKTTLKRKAQK